MQENGTDREASSSTRPSSSTKPSPSTEPSAWRSIIVTAVLTIATVLVTNTINDWLPDLVRQLRGRRDLAIKVLNHNQQPISGVKLTLLSTSDTKGEPVAVDTTDKSGQVYFSTGKGLFIVRAVLCKGGDYGQDLEYSDSLAINLIPDRETINLEKFRPAETPCPNSPSVVIGDIKNLEVKSTKTYVAARLEEGSMAYIDRSYRYTGIPSFLLGRSYVITANEDKCPEEPSSFSLRFGISRPATVYVAHDDRYLKKPSWMTDFEKTTESVSLTLPGKTLYKYSLYRKDFSPGTISLGKNIDGTCRDVGDFGMYSVIVVPKDAQARAAL